MPLQQLTQLAGAMEALSSCVEIQALFTTLLIQAKELCRAEVAWGWLMVDADQLRLQRVEGEPSTLPPRLRRMKMPNGGASHRPSPAPSRLSLSIRYPPARPHASVWNSRGGLAAFQAIAPPGCRRVCRTGATRGDPARDAAGPPPNRLRGGNAA